MHKTDLERGDPVLACVAGGMYVLEFYQWWDDEQRTCTLVDSPTGRTLYVGYDQIICKIGEPVTRLNKQFLLRRRYISRFVT